MKKKTHLRPFFLQHANVLLARRLKYSQYIVNTREIQFRLPNTKGSAVF